MEVMTTQTAQVKNGTIVLPSRIRQSWKTGRVLVFSSQDTLIVKKVRRPLSRLSELPSRISSKKMSQKQIEGEIQAFRKNR
jgi:hypothetical protein